MQPQMAQMHTDKKKFYLWYLCASVPHLWLIFLLLIVQSAVLAADGVSGPWTVPILEIRYFPTTPDGQRIDINITSNVNSKLNDIRKKCDRMTKESMQSL